MKPDKKYAPTFDSLREYVCPQWFKDAKFGIWSHWGPQSVPMYGDWYARNMYIQGTPQYLYHIRRYGHPSKFGYKDICALWKAEHFDPDGLMALYARAGARYFVGQLSHHDHFFNYPSALNRFNSSRVGPMKDICGLWRAAAEKYGLPFGLSEHLSASFSWWSVNKMCDTHGPYARVPYDGNDPEYRDFYHDNFEHVKQDTDYAANPWFTPNRKFHDYWLAVMKEAIARYKPDLLYTDGGLPFGTDPAADENGDYSAGLKAVAALYNASIEQYGENRAVYTHKDRRSEIYSIGVLDVEKSQLSGISQAAWQTDTCIGNWFYDVRQPYKKPAHIIEMLVDIVSKNGNMLLNILQRPDGGIDDETVYLLEALASWFTVCGEGIYATRPWRVFGEGDSRVTIDGFTEEKVVWNSSDFRFTTKGKTVYAFMLCPPENGVAVIKSLSAREEVRAVRLLGGSALPFAQSFGVLTVKIPDRLPVGCANCLAIELS